MERFWGIMVGMAAVMAMLTGCSVKEDTEHLGEKKETTVQYTEEDAVPIYFFHNTACGSCDGTEEFRSIVSEQLFTFYELYPYELHVYNVFRNEGWRSAEKILGEAGLMAGQVSYPAVLVNGRLYEGMREISDHLLEEYLKDAKSTAIYFFRTDCQECNELDSYMSNLPDVVSVGGVKVPFQLIKMNSREGENGEIIREMFTEYEVPEEDQMVPIVFLKEGYLAGQEEIERKLMILLEQGYGLNNSWE